MVSKKINKISSQVDAFYLLIKKAVPLDEIVFTPYSDYYSPNDPLFTSPRKSKKGEMDLPSIEEFKSHFQNTNVKYRIIYSSDTFGLTSGFPISIDRYKSMLHNAIDGKLKKYSGEAMEDAKYLLDNADKIFNPEAINVIANKYDSNDLTGPKGIDHDLGHAILDQYEFDFKSREIINAIQKDYKFVATHHFGTEFNVDFDNLSERLKERIAFVLLTTIIAVNNPIAGSISEMNLKNKELNDFLSDLMIMYNLKGENLKDIKLSGITIYSNSFFSIFGLEPSETLSVKIEPKNLDITNTKKELNELFDKLEKDIKKKLGVFIGKVICLW